MHNSVYYTDWDYFIRLLNAIVIKMVWHLNLFSGGGVINSICSDAGGERAVMVVIVIMVRSILWSIFKYLHAMWMDRIGSQIVVCIYM